jgi:hypothetical protein
LLQQACPLPLQQVFAALKAFAVKAVSTPTATQKESYSAFLRLSTISTPNRTAAITQMIRTIEASIVVLLHLKSLIAETSSSI